MLRKFRHLGILLICLMSMFSCSTAQKTVTEAKLVFLEPPAAMLQPRVVKTPTLKTNKDLLRYTVSLKEALDESNTDKQYIRDWVTKTKEAREQQNAQQ